MTASIELGGGFTGSYGTKTAFTNAEERKGTQLVVFGEDGVTGTRVILCEWGDRKEVLKTLVGYSEKIGDSIQIHYPDALPGFEDFNLRCTSASCRGVGELLDETHVYKKAEITAQYKQSIPDLREGPNDDVLWEEEIDMCEQEWSSDTFAPDEKYKWASDNVLLKRAFILRYETMLLRYHLSKVAKLNLNTIMQLVGSINSTVFKPPAQNSTKFDINTVLFKGASTRRKFQGVGPLSSSEKFVNTPSNASFTSKVKDSTTYDVTLEFEARKESWLKLYRPSSENWEVVSPDMFSEANINALFQLGNVRDA